MHNVPGAAPGAPMYWRSSIQVAFAAFTVHAAADIAAQPALDDCALQHFLPLEEHAERYVAAVHALARNLTKTSLDPHHLRMMCVANTASSMHNAEMLLITAFLAVGRPDVVFESGVFQGRSTAVMTGVVDALGIAPRRWVTACFPRAPPHLAALRELFPFVDLREGGGQDVYRSLAPEANIVAIIDGPKAGLLGESEAFTQLMDGLIRFRNVSHVFFHDMRRKYGSHNLVRLTEWYSRSGAMKGYRLCTMSESIIARFAKRLELGVDPNAKEDPRTHINSILRHGIANLAWIVKDDWMAAALPQEPRSDLKSPRWSVGADPSYVV